MTLIDLYRKVLEKLEIAAAGEAAAPEDTQLVADRYVGLWNQLRVSGLVSWAIGDDVPDEAAQAVIDACVYVCADEFGEDSNRYALAGAIGLPQPSLAERTLRRLHSRAYVSHPARPEYF